ncbi:MAG: hypothetical protein WAN35_07560 [Terracidiphilus sp.]
MGKRPLFQTTRADSACIECVPDEAAVANPSILAAWGPTAFWATNVVIAAAGAVHTVFDTSI